MKLHLAIILLLTLGAPVHARDEAALGRIPRMSGPPIASAIEQTRHTSASDAFLDFKLTLDKAEMTVADRLILDLTATTREQATIQLPTLGPTLGDFTVVSAAPSEQVHRGRRTAHIRAVLEPFLAGDKKLPTLEVRATDGKQVLTLSTEPINLRVAAVAPADASDQTPLEPARGPLPLPPAAQAINKTVLIAAGSAFALLALGTGGVMYARERRRRHDADPLVRARRELDAIQSSLDSDTTRIAAARSAEQLQRTLAAYLHAVFHVPAEARTSLEVAARIVPREVAALGDSPSAVPNAADLTSLLADLERTRFAPDAATAPVVKLLIDRTRAWIDTVAAALESSRRRAAA